jgi:RNA polymerase sigma-70 factor (ECF subfamily)
MLQHLAHAQRFAVRLSGDAAQAEDILHDAIVRAARNCDRFRAEARFTTWLFAIIINVWRDRRSARCNEEIKSEPHDVRSMSPHDASESAELSEIVAQKVFSLPPRQREVLLLIAYERMSAAEAAAVLQISEQNVRVNLFHARERLKIELSSYLGESIRAKRPSIL